MSSMLRKGGKSFKPSARPRPNPTRPSSSQPAAARPSSETQLQAPVSATQPSIPTPTLTEDVAGREPSQTTISEPVQVTPQSQHAPPAQPQIPIATSNDDTSASTNNTAKRKSREDDVDVTLQVERPPTKARKLTPPSDEVQHSGNNAPSQHIPTVPTTIPKAVSAPSNNQTLAEPSRNEQQAVDDEDLPPISHITTNNTTTAKAVPVNPPQTLNSFAPTISKEIPRITTTIDRTRAPASAPTQVIGESLQTPPASLEDADLSGMGAGEASQTSHLVSTVTPTSEEAPTPVDGEAASALKKPRKKAAPRKKKVQVEDGDEDRTEVEIQLNRPRKTGGSTRERRNKDGEAPKKRRDREGTPEDAENEVIEPTVMKMADLCKDIRIGKKFSRHDEIKLRHARKKIDAQLAERPELAGLINNAPPENNAEPVEAPAAVVNNNGLQMRVIDGQIVLDDQSMQVDRHRQARNPGQVLEEIEENEFTRVVNSGQYMKRSAAVRWDSTSNELFYQGLRQFGTAFEMIAAMFPDRNRRQIKLKFVREERQNPAKVDRALKGKTDEIDFEEYTQLTGQKFEDSAEIKAEQQRLEDEHNAEEEKVEAAKAAADRRKKEAISKAGRRGNGGASDGEDGPESQKENTGAALLGMGRKKPAKSKKSNKASMQGGGEEIEILGEV
ncbi:hypothetical protein ACHAPC_001058 [Botrytis cinerea]|uniref:Transcription factor TFIIIB component B'' Myb domain-containing protein n=2 Tax=Botryotinia fuckeliana TaxID=40559 RepID=G2YR89_BOTF4|nr:putative transcription factor tfiiib component protein [Botrytis cinerea BcDW1]CCD54137.1 hypothetical protein BofuT4_P128370.1 [Botrytis cinerea T4]